MTLKEIVQQLKSCDFTCEAGSLEMNTAFVELEAYANKEIKVFNLRDKSEAEQFESSGYMHIGLDLAKGEDVGIDTFSEEFWRPKVQEMNKETYKGHD